MSQFIHVPSTATGSDNEDDDDTPGGNVTASVFRDRIDHPVVDE